MIFSIKELKKLWQKDSDDYRRKEVGTGVQSFVKKVLESEEIFKLKEGNLSTKLINRKNEFIHEKEAKQQRKADFYIFINPDIAIPIEVECYGNIKAGETQLLNYQKDFDKQYGILTDGFTWRFYNNNVYKTYTLETILDNTQLFLTFWREYIKPEFYYLSFFEKTGQLALVEEIILPVEDHRQAFFEDITKLIRGFKNKLQIEGYLEATEDKSKEQRAVELTYAYIIQFILYKTLVDNDFDEFPREFEQLVDSIHQSLKKNAYKDILGVINGISDRISKNIYRPFDKEQEFINTKILELLRSLKNNLNDVSPWLDVFVFIKKYNYANVRNEIFGFIYENYLKELYEESQKGQYFTDPAVVNFMLEQIGYTPEWIKKRFEFDKDSISLIDPACGSGTFLYAATDIIVQAFKDGFTEEASKKIEEAVTNNIFGLDIEEFPLYLAEMSVLMRLLPLIINQKYNNPIDKKIKVFKTRDSVSEFMDTAIRNTVSDMNVEYEKAGHSSGQISMFTDRLNLGYESYVRDEDDLKEMKQSLEQQPNIPRRRFDFVIGNPPYIGYNQASKEKVLIVKLIQQNKAQMSNIYGVNLNTVPGRIKAYAPKPNLYAFFVALGLALLKDNGTICYIIPQTVLTSTDLDVLRYHLAKYTTIEKIVTFSGKVFLGRGIKQNTPIPTSSLIFVISRRKPPNLHQVQITNSKNKEEDLSAIFESISKNKKIQKKKILQSELARRIVNWNFIKFDKLTEDFFKQYKNGSESVDIYRLPELAKHYNLTKLVFDKGLVFLKSKIVSLSDKVSDEQYYYLPKISKNGYRLSKSDKAIPTSAIRLPKGSQGLKVFDSKYKLVWRYMNYDQFYFSDENIMVNFNWIVISTDGLKEAQYFLSLLNSKVSRFIFESLLRSAGEKDLLLGIKAVKDHFRVPRITKDNQHIKDKVIDLTEKLLSLEQITLVNLVDFSGVMTQKFDSVVVGGAQLVLKRSDKETRLTIRKDKELISKFFSNVNSEPELGLEKKEIALSELKTTPVIDLEKQKAIKNHIDDLVFALYFNIFIPENKVSDPEFIKSLCSKSKFYKIVERNIARNHIR